MPRAYTYKVISGPVNLAVDLATVKQHLRVTSTDEDALITQYINAAIAYAEKKTRRDFITRTYETFRDEWPYLGTSEGYYDLSNNYYSSYDRIRYGDAKLYAFELRKSPLQSVSSVEYLVDGSFVTLANTVYYNTLESDYSEVLLAEDQCWPEDKDQGLQSIKITFVSGFGDTSADVPEDIKTALLMHVTHLYQNRGDCSNEGMIPSMVNSIYLQSRIENL